VFVWDSILRRSHPNIVSEACFLTTRVAPGSILPDGTRGPLIVQDEGVYGGGGCPVDTSTLDSLVSSVWPYGSRPGEVVVHVAHCAGIWAAKVAGKDEPNWPPYY